ncbi:tyrosine-type recombinase/integrase [Bradyrhizobium diazoefficiens]|uniref:tyrosine-type recombinase/integrase n=1 Tax=Bradyrhizobium diazoefficiens TaxID=1355477 RepID=UPI000BE8F4C1|nr:tyrosine-type recombinase/integrase [Bradyrhizobium diazoefficiens]PDT56197.1 integrase [Bradyrhizobium diazoefficiens]WLB40527.1 tyrosine-type recombinase/integrase [Bradyrhizobium diazoefficiens]WLC14496.1 tyrosine-type recombinase/integrase [Bradyrhizobium diazoefficiens]
MIKTRLRYCVYDPDPRGNPRYYVRKPGFKKVRIREVFEDRNGNISPEFMLAYFAALDGLSKKAAAPPSTPREKTFYWLVDQYCRSEEFKRFDVLTQNDKRGVLNRFCESAGNLPYEAFRTEDVERSRDKRSATPGAADKLVKYLRSLFKWAVRKKHAKTNPAIGVEKINETEGWHTWTRSEVERYRKHHEIGSKARLALEIMLNIGARRSDACRIGRQHEVDGYLEFVAWKGRNRAKTRKTIVARFTAELKLALTSTPTGDLTYLVNDLGRPFTIAGFGNKMREWCDAAGLSQCSSHGLRKASAVAMAESGARAPELCALFGWSKLETAEIYIREANKRVMVDNAFARLDEHRRKSVSLRGPKPGGETKRRNNSDKSTRK